MSPYSHLSPQAKLRGIAECVLAEHSSHQEKISALDAFIELCNQAVEIKPDLSYIARSGDTELSHGIAINPAAAAQCVKDYNRSIQFIRAVHYAIRLEKVSAGKKTRSILYAGCGPFATLLLPLLPLLSEFSLDIHLLDIHEESLSSIQTLLAFFNFTNHSIQFHCENACDFESESLFDIIIAETMQKALEQEPQFMVTAQLSKFLKNEGIFIPDEISVSLAIQEKISLEVFKAPIPLIKLSATLPLLKEIDKRGCVNNQRLGLRSVQIWPEFDAQYHQLVLQTRIRVFDTIWLDEEESDITLAVPAFSLRQAQAEQWWQTDYYFGSYPCIEFYPVEATE